MSSESTFARAPCPHAHLSPVPPQTVSTLKKWINDPIAARVAQAAADKQAEKGALGGGGGGSVGAGFAFSGGKSGVAPGAGGAGGTAIAKSVAEPKRVITDAQAEVEASGKLRAMVQLLLEVKQTTTDRFVLISNSTTILDLFEAVLKLNRLPLIRLDGAASPRRRTCLPGLLPEPRPSTAASAPSSLKSDSPSSRFRLIAG